MIFEFYEQKYIEQLYLKLNLPQSTEQESPLFFKLKKNHFSTYLNIQVKMVSYFKFQNLQIHKLVTIMPTFVLSFSTHDFQTYRKL